MRLPDWFAAGCCAAAACGAQAEDRLRTPFLSRAEEIELALSAGPEHVRDGATVYVFGRNGYEKVREGVNGFVCLVNRDGNQHNDRDLKPTCWDAEGSRTIVPVMLRVGELLANGKSAAEIRADIDSGFSNAQFVPPKKAGIAYMLRGDIQFDPQSGALEKVLFPPHYMLYAPGVTAADIGMNADIYKKQPSLPRVFSGYSGAPHTTYIIVLAHESAGHSR